MDDAARVASRAPEGITEEVLADNFAQLVTGRTVPNPGLLRRIEAVLLAPR